ncbi:CidA/LrgA family holin-like protein [Rossellomorea marisflavi]|uniref:CidA/LrgA family holin-like protein n=1 Tax=Rossellomorea marisflavi TaxID=189381 RepID=UPI0027992ECD|nr:CidA/LrgA family holin-like protein [Rossellomorea marisflavi]MDR4935028.1 CidA/LrgA family holin-like protein [Rossellomorea marisflavi]UTE73132.1 CidA/LrgA family holin-like protein [Rossellomorea marisflavi]
MKILRIILQVGILYVFSFAGGWIQQALDLPIAGSIVGLLLLLLCLAIKVVPVVVVEDGASFLLSILPLLFIPAMAGVMNYPGLVSPTGAALFLIVIVSTVVTIAVAGHASQLLEKRSKRKEEKRCSNSCSQS